MTTGVRHDVVMASSTPAGGGAFDRPGASSPWRSALGTLARDPSAMTGLAMLVALALIALAAPYVAPYDPRAQPDILSLKDLPPTFAHPFGTDHLSRDVLSRIIFGSRVSLSVAFLSVVVAATVGTGYGAIAGYVGGRLDGLMMRIVDALLAIPRVLLLIAVATLWNGFKLTGLVLLLGLTGWFGVSRLVRTLVLSAREDEFVAAARALGATHTRILTHHILPQVISPVLVAATLAIGNVIVIEAGLTFLGMGVGPPNASWGSIFYDGMRDVRGAWWVSVSAGAALVVTVLAVNLVADGLREALNARQLPAR
ncbi:MAG TPA: ABC transporter permease [Gemmatimonadaceae bacterium]|nr:ABC transporter permease [Gemmatimonadaceae bacterium]